MCVRVYFMLIIHLNYVVRVRVRSAFVREPESLARARAHMIIDVRACVRASARLHCMRLARLLVWFIFVLGRRRFGLVVPVVLFVCFLLVSVDSRSPRCCCFWAEFFGSEVLTVFQPNRRSRLRARVRVCS